jgi:hypothetical protein
MNRRYHACGCGTGAAGLLAGAVVGFVALPTVSAGVACARWGTAGICFAIGGACIGKALGWARARAQMKSNIREIVASVSGQSDSVGLLALTGASRAGAEEEGGTSWEQGHGNHL